MSVELPRPSTLETFKLYFEELPQKKRQAVGVHAALVLMLAFTPMAVPPRTAAAVDTQPKSPEPGIVIPVIKPLEPIAEPQIKPIEPLEPVQTATAPAPASNAPASPTSGCVSGYFTGDVYLDNIIRFESSGNSCATNPGGCFGLLQACPGAPLRAACGGDPACQIRWFIDNKTGGRSWAQVWQHELDYGWW